MIRSEELERILANRDAFSGTLFTCKKSKYSPAEPSGAEGRYSGQGMSAYYLADSPIACWREILGYNPEAEFTDYSFWSVSITGTFIDVGAVEGTRYVQPKAQGGWEPTQELSRGLRDQAVLGIRYASSPAIEAAQSGTCFCIYRDCLELQEDEFSPVRWEPEF